MSKAQDILDERLAKGEITEQEHHSLSEKISKSDAKNQAAQAHHSAAASEDKGVSFNFWKLWPIIPIIGAVIWFSSIKNNLVIESISADSPLFAATTVTAVVYNDGAAKKYRYWVVKGSSETQLCPGDFFIGENERRTIHFQCAALSNYTGKFGFRTSTQD